MKRIPCSVLLIVAITLVLSACGPKEPANHLEAIKQEGPALGLIGREKEEEPEPEEEEQE